MGTHELQLCFLRKKLEIRISKFETISNDQNSNDQNMYQSAPNRMQSGLGHWKIRILDLLLIYLEDWAKAEINKQYYMKATANEECT